MPPLDAAGWQAAFEKYQAIPQYQRVNRGMSLDEFKTIYWWEWGHRLLGRLIGVVFLVPFLWFLWRGWVDRRLGLALAGIFALGAVQGAVGWWMVASGLTERVSVSQYRLAFHLTLACAIYAALLWTAGRTMTPARPPRPAPPRRLVLGAAALVGLVLGQIYLGALVAGLHAGLIYNTWPLIDGSFIPSAANLFYDQPPWRNFFENALTVQFDHRMVAYGLGMLALVHVIDCRATTVPVRLALTAGFLAVAIIRASSDWHYHVVGRAPLGFALMHQAMALVVLTAATLHAARVVVARAASSLSSHGHP